MDLASTFVVLDPNQRATTVPFTPTVFEELDRRFMGFKGHLLVATFDFDSDWKSWERHPAGDEVVCLLSGEVTFVFEKPGGPDPVQLAEAGAFAIVPAGVWHTAKTSVPTRMLFITPGEGTEHRNG